MSHLLPCYSRQHVNHVTKVSTPPTLVRHPCKHATNASKPPMLPTLARHAYKEATHASMLPRPPTPPMLASIARHFSNSIIFHGFHLKCISNLQNMFILIITNVLICWQTLKPFFAWQFFFKLFKITHIFIRIKYAALN